MKKLKLSLVIALLGMASIVGAQNAFVNVKAGLNMSNFYGDNLSNKDVKPGFNIGVGVDLEFATNLSLQTGLYYTSKGAEYSTSLPLDMNDLKYDVTANYIQLPIHLAYKKNITRSAKLFFHAGPYMAYGISGKRNMKSGFSNDKKQYFGEQEINTFDKKFGYKRWDMGVGLGVGAEFKKIVIDLGWDMGLMKTARNIEGLPMYKPNMKNQSAYLSVGFKF